jgi:hypothetical protein
MTPSLAKVSFNGRGFPVTPSDVTTRLEAVPDAVICGFEWGIDTHNQWEVERRLSIVDPELLGFAYEGVTMAFTILDAMGPGRGRRTRDFLLGPGQPHIFLAYIGIGFAMARLPRPLWKKVLPDLSGSAYYPTMSWLAVDGYGFDRAYFDTDRWVTRQWRRATYPWRGRPDYFPRVRRSGIAGFCSPGAQARRVAAAVEPSPNTAPDRGAVSSPPPAAAAPPRDSPNCAAPRPACSPNWLKALSSPRRPAPGQKRCPSTPQLPSRPWPACPSMKRWPWPSARPWRPPKELSRPTSYGARRYAPISDHQPDMSWSDARAKPQT